MRALGIISSAKYHGGDSTESSISTFQVPTIYCLRLMAYRSLIVILILLVTGKRSSAMHRFCIASAVVTDLRLLRLIQRS